MYNNPNSGQKEQRTSNVPGFLLILIMLTQVALSAALLFKINSLEERLFSDGTPFDVIQMQLDELEEYEPVIGMSVADAAIAGYEDAPITIVEFSDFQCPACKSVQPLIEELLSNNKNKFRLAYRHFPLPSHVHAAKSAEAAECAGEQGRFWEMHDMLFANQYLEKDDLERYASEVGLDTSRFVTCLESGRFVDKVNADIKAGKSYGVKAVPTFFINGRVIPGAYALEVFQRILDDEWKKIR